VIAMSLDRLIDPFGFGLAASEPRDPGEGTNAPMPAPEGAAEAELAAQAEAGAGADVVTPTEDVASSDLDPVLRLQDTPDTWLDDQTGAGSDVQEGEDLTYYAPLEDSGGQGV
jgi:hypothetical protein